MLEYYISNKLSKWKNQFSNLLQETDIWLIYVLSLYSFSSYTNIFTYEQSKLCDVKIITWLIYLWKYIVLIIVVLSEIRV